MTTAYTSLLGLALPVTGELSGTWGDTVNNSITSLLDSAIAGTTTLSSDADVTLTTTTGAANTSREAILLWTAGGTVTRNITAPAQSKAYYVINASTSTQSIVLRGAGPTTGVTVIKGEYAVCAWNGTDFVKVSSNQFTALTGTVPVANGGTGITSGTSGGVLAFTAAGTIASSAALTSNAIVLGGGAGASPTVLGSLGTTATVLHGNASGAPTFGAVSLTTDISGILGAANGGTGVANNAASTITISGSFGTTLTVSGTTAVTLPTTGTLATLAGSETFTNKTLTNPTVTNYVETLQAVGTVGASSTLALTNGTVLTATLTASTPCTFTMPTATAGKSFILILTQAATGMTTATFTGVKWPGGTAPTITATASAVDIISFVANGSVWYGNAAQAFA